MVDFHVCRTIELGCLFLGQANERILCRREDSCRDEAIVGLLEDGFIVPLESCGDPVGKQLATFLCYWHQLWHS
jgi:hypothetical protein